MSPEDRRPAITPQLAVRIAILGGIALGAFAIIFFRLWFLQVLSGEEYVSQARENRTRSVRIAAPRGRIVDRNNRLLVDNRPSNVVEIEPQGLPDRVIDDAATWGQRVTQLSLADAAKVRAIDRQNPDTRAGRRARKKMRAQLPKRPAGERVAIPAIGSPQLRARYQELGRVIGMRPRQIHRRVIEQLAVLPFAAVTVRSDVPRSVLAYVEENRKRFPGVAVEQVFLRSYPRGDLAAQLLGNVGQINREELKLRRNRRVTQGTMIGKTGIEYTYDRYLRGTDGAKVLRVDASGAFRGELPRRREPRPGRQLRVSLDMGLQKAGQQAMRDVAGSLPGAFVAMDPKTGQVYALGSMPTFDPSVFAKPISQATLDQLNSEANGAPLFNRAIGGFYPTGSTFKPITALAALDSGIFSTGTIIQDNGCMKIGIQERCNAGDQPHGPVALERSLQVSSDIYYYTAGRDLNPVKGQPLQTWSRRLSLGRRTGIDVPNEGRGLVPDAKWRAGQAEIERMCRKKRKIPLSVNVYVAAAQGCGISDMREWSVGDNVSLAIGQGDLQASPLQMAVAYATIANGGRVPRPHLGLEIQDQSGRLVQDIDPGAARNVDIQPEYAQAIMRGLAAAAQAPGGTSAGVFSGWPHSRLPVHGKTGTAERPPHGDQSWYVAYVPAGARSLIVAVTVERGGFGAETAAPIACRIMRQWYSVNAPCAAVESIDD
jgi:penicillin-binding protein 2